MKIIIEVSGGVVCNIKSTDPCEIFIIDHDMDNIGFGFKYSLFPDIITESSINQILTHTAPQKQTPRHARTCQGDKQNITPKKG